MSAVTRVSIDDHRLGSLSHIELHLSFCCKIDQPRTRRASGHANVDTLANDCYGVRLIIGGMFMSTKPDKPTTSVTEADTSSALDLEELEAVQGGHHSPDYHTNEWRP